jgi:hypothetical protein
VRSRPGSHLPRPFHFFRTPSVAGEWLNVTTGGIFHIEVSGLTSNFSWIAVP